MADEPDGADLTRGSMALQRMLMRSCFRIWHLALIVAALATSVLMFSGKDSLSRMLASALEQRFPPTIFGPEQQVDGIIAPGGGFKRFEVAVELAKRFPRARLLLIVGGEIERARSYAIKHGIPDTQLIIEARSTNTYENARFSAVLLAPRPCQRWVLVTSASHMPRAVGTFRKAGFDVLPLPVFYPTDIPQRDTLYAAMHEWVGLVSYWFLGRTDAIFPGPSQAAHNARAYAGSEKTDCRRHKGAALICSAAECTIATAAHVGR
jgi:uncharacterized SAM-binding protein YcdF (DUF218 family)